ncbi:73 kDa subunit [Hexamita inflata]|uniref:73 kDa subunit n=1 Tax=Hexamita inflata TaxID=28002 RepID=A0AA86PND9_9EUKA|nr:73 kDa subunit [Hexamita inflata]
MDNIYIRSLGNAPFIGKACIFVDIPGECQFILDAGTTTDSNQASLQIQKQFNHDGRTVIPFESDFVFISHGHQDHAGAIEQLKDMKCPIYASKITRALVDQSIIPVQFYEPVYPIKGKNDIKFTITPASHIPGAAIFTYESPSVTLVYTGDWQLQDSFMLSRAEFLQRPVDIFITESTFAQLILNATLCEQVTHYQQVSLLSAQNSPTIHPVMTSGQAQSLASQLTHFAHRLGQSGYEITQGQQKQIHLNYVSHSSQSELNPISGLNFKPIFSPYKQFVQSRQLSFDKSRRVLISAPQKLVGGITLDLIFENIETKDALLVMNSAIEGSLQWRLYHQLVQQVKRDNMKEFVKVQLQGAVLSYATHCDFADLTRVVQWMKPALLVGTHCSRLQNLKILEDMVSFVSPESRYVTLQQGVITVKRRMQQLCSDNDQKPQQCTRIKLNIPLQQAIDRLFSAGIYMRKWGDGFRCGGLMLYEDLVIIVGSPLQYHYVCSLLEIDFTLVLAVTK